MKRDSFLPIREGTEGVIWRPRKGSELLMTLDSADRESRSPVAIEWTRKRN